MIDGRNGLTPALALHLINQLPVESRTVAKLRGGTEFLGWGPDRYLLARLIESVDTLTYVTVAANSKKKPKPPPPVERPETRAKKKRENGFMAVASRALGMRRSNTDGEGSGR